MARRIRNGADSAEQPPRKRGRKPAEPPKSNLTDETIAEFYGKALAAKAEHEDAVKVAKEKNGIYRAVLKDFKKLGGNPDDIVWRLGQRHRSPEEIDAETKRRNRIARLTNLPIGTQLGMFDDAITVATAIENDAKADDGIDSATAAYEAGYASGVDGEPIEKTGYSEDSMHWLEFLRGRGDGGKASATRPGGIADGAALQ